MPAPTPEPTPQEDPTFVDNSWDELEQRIATEPVTTLFHTSDEATMGRGFETWELTYNRSKGFLTRKNWGGVAEVEIHESETFCSNVTDADIARGWEFIRKNRPCIAK